MRGLKTIDQVHVLSGEDGIGCVEINIAGDAYQIQFDLSEQGRQTDG